MTYISHLIEKREFEDAARACVRVLGNDVELWDKMVFYLSDGSINIFILLFWDLFSIYKERQLD